MSVRAAVGTLRSRCWSRLVVCGLFAGTAVVPAFASWRAEGNLVMTGRSGLEGLEVIADGAGGFFVMASGDTGSVLFAQRGLIGGDVAAGWPNEGTAVETGRGGWRSVSADGQGGLYVTWRRINPESSSVIAQHILADGTRAPGWADSGVVVADGFVGPAMITVAADAAGGCFLAWQDFRRGYADQDAYVQRLTAGGEVAAGWPANGIPLCLAPDDQDDPELLADGEGGVFAVWWDRRAPSLTDWDIYATRMRSDGTIYPGWPEDGLALCTAPQAQMLPSICPDGAGGFFVAWTDYRSGLTGPSAYLTRVLPRGEIAPGWPAGGARLSGGSASGTFTLLPDGFGGVYLGVMAQLELESYERRVHHWTGDGMPVPGWPDGGLAVFSGIPSWIDVRFVKDSAGGIFAGAAEHFPSPTVRLIRLGSDGRHADGWREPWLELDLPEPWAAVGMAEDGEGGVIVAWQNSLHTAVLAQRVTGRGVLAPGWDGYPEAAWLGFPYPNPSSGAQRIPLALPETGPARLTLYDALGARVATLLARSQGAGGQQLLLWDGRDDGGRRIPAGVYQLRLSAGSRVETRRICVLPPKKSTMRYLDRAVSVQ